MLGTETVRELRAADFQGRICGLSANDIEEEFLKSGANAFMFKPFPTSTEAIQYELKRILFSTGKS
jgi:hypothetical protein